MSVLLHLDVERLRRCAWCKGPFTPSVRFNKSNFHFLEKKVICMLAHVSVCAGREEFPLEKAIYGLCLKLDKFCISKLPVFYP